MHIFIAWSFLSPIIVVVCGQQVYDLYYGARVDIRIGSPIQELVACPSLTTDIIFMISANCGEVDSRRCPRYCYDPLFSEMYCTAECRGMDEIEWCKKPIYRYYKHYDSKNSSTSRRTEDVWNGVLNGHVAQVGQWTRETISFNPAPYNNTRILKMEDWLFVNGMIVNVEILSYFESILGLAPGESNFVHLLFKQHRIPKPVISILWVGYRLTVGDYNREYCSNWWHMKAVGLNWILKFDSVEFCNRTWQSDVYMTFNLYDDVTYIPDDQFDELLNSGVIVHHLEHTYHVSCDADFDMKFTSDERELLISTSSLGSKVSKDCLLFIAPHRDHYLGSRVYVDEPTWIIGNEFLRSFCIAYNYGTNEIGFANAHDKN